MRDFTLHAYKVLCLEFKKRGYEFVTFADYCANKIDRRFVLLRHDVDTKPLNALKVAQLENQIGVRSSFYFRIVKHSYDENIINVISKLEHEIGYHYEDFASARGNGEKAIRMFERNLGRLNKLCRVKTICMHGSPLCKFDNLRLWQEYEYRDFGIAGEVYLDTDFSEVFYLTDTGRCWNGREVTVRDRVSSRYERFYKSTFDIIKSLRNHALPHKVMINAHPQRWNDEVIPWFRELIWQNCKNVVKKYVLVR